MVSFSARDKDIRVTTVIRPREVYGPWSIFSMRRDCPQALRESSLQADGMRSDRVRISGSLHGRGNVNTANAIDGPEVGHDTPVSKGTILPLVKKQRR